MKHKVPVKVGSTILLLNSTYEPLTMINWKRATTLVIKSKAHVISNRTIRLKYYVKVPVRKMVSSRPTRSLILKRDNHTCQYCEYKGPNLTIDHILPKSRGGEDTYQNLVTSCLDCNNCKDNRTPEEWAQALKDVFEKRSRNGSVLPSSWDHYQIGMLEARVLRRGTTLAEKPKVPYSKIAISIATSEVEEWRSYIYS